MTRRTHRTATSASTLASTSEDESAAIAIEADDSYIADALDGYVHGPLDLISGVIADMNEIALSERAMMADQFARLHASMEGNRASHISKGWRALSVMFMMEALERRHGGVLSLQWRQATIFECAHLRKIAGTYFIRGGARLVGNVMPLV